MAELARFITSRFAELANPDDATRMAAYMKTDMPCWGIKKPQQTPVLRSMVKTFPPSGADEYRSRVRELWALPHREDRYAAIHYARAFSEFQTPEMLDLYEFLIRDGAWWDLVDDVAINLVGAVWLEHRSVVSPVMDQWIEDEDLWVRRAAIIGQLKHKGETDTERLFRYCRQQAPETEFFIRKAIGWALRQHARVDPESVRAFLAEMGDELSGLSRREAAKHL